MDREAAASSGQILIAWRRNILQEIGESSLQTITIEKCRAWHGHSITYQVFLLTILPRCQDLEGIFF